MNPDTGTNAPPRIVLIGAGFGGLYAAKALKRMPVRLTLLDRRNFHLFQPLLYQVAAGSLSPGDIAAPIRAEFNGWDNVEVLQAEVADINPQTKQITFTDNCQIHYDYLVVATGSQHHYFGRDADWEPIAPGLKTIEDALEMRGKILHAFEAAEREPDDAARRAWMTFVVVGGGPTGVELAGTLGELAHQTLRGDFRHIRVQDTRILLVENSDRLLGPYSPQSAAHAQSALKKLGVEVRTTTMVAEVEKGHVILKSGDKTERVDSHTILWAAGVKASPLGRIIAERTGAQVDRIGRVMVQPDMTVAGFPELFVIGDLAHCAGVDGKPLPGVAPVAMQHGRYIARAIKARLRNQPCPPFRYLNKGNMAVIGRNKAIAEVGSLRLWGFPAWFAWAFIHIAYLVQFESRFVVLIRWATDYFLRKRGSRLITGEALASPRKADPASTHPPAAPLADNPV